MTNNISPIQESEKKIHAIEFADWKEAYERVKSQERHRWNLKHGMACTIGPTTAQIYDKWMNRPVMTYQQAMELAHDGIKVTRPRIWAFQRGWIETKDGKIRIRIRAFEYENLLEHFYSDDKTADDWRVLSDHDIESAP